MEKVYQLTENELNTLTCLIEEIDIIHGQLINHGLPDDEFIRDKLSEIGKLNSLIGRRLGVWEDEEKEEK